jgi:hypothetical protein
MSKQRTPTADGLNGSTRLRLHNQLGRAFNQCFGAEQGLRVLVKLATAQMLATGSSRTAIRHALMSVVSDYPGGVGETVPEKSAQPRTAALTAMMLSWSDRTTVPVDGAD